MNLELRQDNQDKRVFFISSQFLIRTFVVIGFSKTKLNYLYFKILGGC